MIFSGENAMKKILAAFLALSLISGHAAAQKTRTAKPKKTVQAQPETQPQTSPEAQSAKPDFSTIHSRAMTGDIAAQRSLAFSYTSIPLEGQSIDLVQGCAWFTVILKSGHKDIDKTDSANRALFCKNLTPKLNEESDAEAEKLLKQIYKK
jgi:hypothetical protein